jgi:hypothetical protein
MSNTIITPTIIADLALIGTFEESKYLKRVWRANYEKDFGKKIGTSLQVRRPVRLDSYDGPDITSHIQDVQESYTTFTLATNKVVPWAFSSIELTMKISEYNERYIKPAARRLANDVDRACALLYRDVYQSVGTPGTTPASFAVFGDAAELMDKSGCPEGNRHLGFTSKARYTMADALKGLLLEAKVKSMIEKADVDPLSGFDIFSSNNTYRHTRGTATGTPLVATSTECGGTGGSATYYTASDTAEESIIYTDGWTDSTANMLRQGDVFTIPDVYAVNRVDGANVYDNLQQFVVKSAVTSGAASGSLSAGYMAVTVSPAIVLTGPYQTVDAAPVANAEITVRGVAQTKTLFASNMAFHEQAFGFASVPFEKIDSIAWGAERTEDGLSIAVVKDFDIMTRKEIVRLDVLFGTKTLHADWACRIDGE